MADILLSTLNYIEGESEVYAETISRTDKPLASFSISFDDEPDNWETVRKLESSIKEKAKTYNIKYYVRDCRQEYRDSKTSPIFSTPMKQFIYYKDESILEEYLHIMSKKVFTKNDHRRLGEIYGYTKESIKEYLSK